MDVTRRYTFKLQPSKTQADKLERHLDMHRDLYNALLQQRIEAWERCGVTLGYYDQCKGLTALRADDLEYRALSSGSMAATAQRLDRAYKAFFKRAKTGAGASSGFPRFKGRHFFDSIGFKALKGGGWNFDKRGKKTWSARFQDVPGRIRARGKFPIEPSDIRSCEIIRREGSWWLSVVTHQPARMASAGESAKIVMDPIESFAVVTPQNGRRAPGPEARFEWVKGRISQRYEEVAGDWSERSSELGESTGGDERHNAQHGSERSSELGESAGMQAGAAAPGQFERSSELGESTGLLLNLGCSHGLQQSSELGESTGLPVVGVVADGLQHPPELGESTGGRVSANALSALQQRLEVGKIEQIQQRMARCKIGSNRYRKLKLRKAKLQARQRRAKNDAMHVWSSQIVAEYNQIEIVHPPLREATKRADGAAVKMKSDLNKFVLNNCVSAAVSMLSYKSEEASGAVHIALDREAQSMVGNQLVEAAKAVKKVRRKLKRATCALPETATHPSDQQVAA